MDSRPMDNHDGSRGPPIYTPNVYSAEELKLLKKCNDESFYYRSLPFAAILSGSAFLAMRRGKWQKSERFGYIPKMATMGFLGHIIGKISYSGECIEKFVYLQDSKIGEALRKQRGITLPSTGIEPSFSSVGHEFHPSQGFDDHRPDQRDYVEGFEDYNRVTESLAPYVQESEKQQEKSYVNYADLRKQNREQYAPKTSPDTNRPSQPVFPSQPPPPLETTPNNNQPAPRRNQYGDVVD